jgi:hypothetical protein
MKLPYANFLPPLNWGVELTLYASLNCYAMKYEDNKYASLPKNDRLLQRFKKVRYNILHILLLSYWHIFHFAKMECSLIGCKNGCLRIEDTLLKM